MQRPPEEKEASLKKQATKTKGTFMQQTIPLIKGQSVVTEIKGVVVSLVSVMDGGKVNLKYIINDATYKEFIVHPKTIVGRRIDGYLYLFEVHDSNDKGKGSASIKVMKISV